MFDHRWQKRVKLFLRQRRRTLTLVGVILILAVAFNYTRTGKTQKMPSLTLVEDTAAVSNAGSTGALSSGKPEAAKEAAPQIRPATRAAEPASPASAKPPTPVEPALKPAPPKAAPAAPAAPPKPAAAANEAPATGNPAAVKPAATAAPEAEKPKPHPMDTSGQNIGSGLPKGPWQFPPVGADAKRLEAVRNGFVHAWRGYEKHAWGRDEVRPVSKSGGDPFGGMGATIVDSLDVLWLMGLRDEFNRSRDWVRDHLRFDNKGDVSVFETTIRVLGGLMSAHDLSGDPVFLDKAKQLADRLLPAFRTPSGLPQATVSLSSGRAHNPGWAGGMNCLAEIATLQLEFTQVSHNSGDPKYAKAAQAVIEAMDKMNPPHGLFATNVDTGAGRFVGESVTFGARGDSGFEYFAKMWVLLGKGEEAAMYRRLYDKAMDGVVSKLLQRSTPGGLLYIAEMEGYRNLRHKMDHLACFAPAMLALGAQGAPPNRTAAAELHMLAARELMVTCVEMYRRQPTGLAPELVHFRAGSDFTTDSWHNLLRPETVESLFYLWRYTHDPQYREWGWEIFQAFEKHARTEVAYSGIRDVRKIPPALDDRMESFFMAETMKYLYLLFCDDDVIPLDEYVFNTEAHPLRVHRKPAAPAPAPAPDAEEE